MKGGARVGGSMNEGRAVPMLDLRAQLQRIRPEVDEAVERVITSTQFVHGEDCGRLEEEFAAQARGAEVRGRRAGSLGHAACFSFYPSKNLGACGDAGMVTASDPDFVARVRQLANHGGGASKYDNVVLGTNSRLDTLQAA